MRINSLFVAMRAALVLLGVSPHAHGHDLATGEAHAHYDRSVKPPAERLLFDLGADLAEQHDLAKSQTQIADDLAKRLHAYLATVSAAMPKPNPDFDPAQEPTGRRGGQEGKGGRKKGVTQ